MSKQPEIAVGIVWAHSIRFKLNGLYSCGNYKDLTGDATLLIKDQKISVQIADQVINGSALEFVPQDETNSFDLFDVLIGIQFHWERKEDQRFCGKLKFIIEQDKVWAINILQLEDYLLSVISSEMSATSSLELLKSHAIISRSWLIAQIIKGKSIKKEGNYHTIAENDDEYIQWFDREDHLLFDVCADDHCQRYQGLTKVSTTCAEEALKATEGQILIFENKVCDARFSKCCGGISEAFEHVWEPKIHPYLTRIIDHPQAKTYNHLDLRVEEQAHQWISTNPEAFCNTHDKHTLQQILNDYDQETQDFFRWKVTYSQNEISNLLHTKTGFDFGTIIDLIPIERGVSGRIIKLKIVGSKLIKILGKELIIRKALSTSHLYSSAFIVTKGADESFTLSGAGWGHGVGLCQIGAAVMGANGYSYQQILSHYFPGSELEKHY